MRKALRYLARIIAILFVLFLGVFVLEGFSPGFGLMDAVMHGLLTLVVVGVTITAWKWPAIGGWIFIVLGIFAAIFFHSSSIWNGFLIAGVPFLAGVLFLIDGSWARRASDRFHHSFISSAIIHA